MSDTTAGFTTACRARQAQPLDTVVILTVKLLSLVELSVVQEGELAGHTGGAVVFMLVLLLWLYAAYRLWIVWAYKLNFEQVSPTYFGDRKNRITGINSAVLIHQYLCLTPLYGRRVRTAGTSSCSGSRSG